MAVLALLLCLVMGPQRVTCEMLPGLPLSPGSLAHSLDAAPAAPALCAARISSVACPSLTGDLALDRPVTGLPVELCSRSRPGSTWH